MALIYPDCCVQEEKSPRSMARCIHMSHLSQPIHFMALAVPASSRSYSLLGALAMGH